MFEIYSTKIFRTWVDGLRDRRAVTRIFARIARAEEGNLGDVKPVGEGVSEMRIHYGPGYRVYFTRRGKVVLLLLCGGDKDSQASDIAEAKRVAQNSGEISEWPWK
ncbi:type II toxin-antitoxin system RelE/ParE family toxin [Neorhizobium sp. CSC1952]|uniref:type II toxin-antitoxin system RelE/ParE family toxin n=1 Tax=Neorhizobium sp. CSC1952 TaxID=2978974 RepID=UPI0025A64061|nr:type II toxin-antitoxin system RelE/ParE family toxin [Rhizobium sp. CSC1952]WJR65988.1 type II toxin-antitoxin system RelE/ParE family toxin [Rhizobium sp. CSC1952]